MPDNTLKEQLKIDVPQMVKRMEDLISEKMNALKRDGVILGISGGLDSAVVAALITRAIGPGKVLALIMPEKDSALTTRKDAEMVAKHYGIKTKLVDLTPYLKLFDIYKMLPAKFLPRLFRAKAIRKFYQYYRQKSGETFFATQILGTRGYPYQEWLNKSAAYYRIKHRLRMVLMYWQAELNNLLYVSAANQTEWQTGFFVKWGVDGGGDVMPILPFYKTQVRELAKYLDVPQKIINKAPSPDIMPGITDEYAMGISYDKLDLILVGLKAKMPFNEIAEQAGVDEEMIEYVNKLNKRSEHMRKVYVPKLNNED